MYKIVGKDRLTKLIACKVANANRNNFLEHINTPNKLNNTLSLIGTIENVALDVVSFSSSKDFNEQILSILSFIRYVGKPISWTIYSDGSHTNQETEVINCNFPFANIKKLLIEDDNLYKIPVKPTLEPHQEELIHFAKNHFLGKKLFFYLNHIIKNPTIFLDSDVLFYKKATLLNSILKEKAVGWYLPDAVWGCLDSRYKHDNAPSIYQVNSGFIIINNELQDLSKGLDFLKRMNYRYEYFSEQTIIHILSKDNEFMPLDPRKFILTSEDQFTIIYKYTPENMAIRHYTGPVRHKMWQRDWRWHLSL